MNLRRPSRSAQGEPTTALIDVVFFLLVFFMLIGRMDATAPFDVAPPLPTRARTYPLAVQPCPSPQTATSHWAAER